MLEGVFVPDRNFYSTTRPWGWQAKYEYTLGSPAAKDCRGDACNFLRRDISNVLGESPTVSEWIAELPVAVAPELVLQRLQHLGACIQCTLPESFHIFGGEVQYNRGTAHGLRGKDSSLREFIRDHHG